MFKTQAKGYGLQSIGIFGLGVGAGYLAAQLLKSRQTNLTRRPVPERFRVSVAPSRSSSFGLMRFDSDLVRDWNSHNNRLKSFYSLPYVMDIAHPVPTVVSWSVFSGAPPHKVVISLPGNPPYVVTLPDSSGSHSLTFIPPENPGRTEDLGSGLV